jgi:hypothetical protein
MQSWCLERCFRSSGIAENIRPFTDRHLNVSLNKLTVTQQRKEWLGTIPDGKLPTDQKIEG